MSCRTGRIYRPSLRSHRRNDPAPSETAAERKARVVEILRRLDKMYTGASCALIHRDPWQLLVERIFSAQCTDKRDNEVNPGLFDKYPTTANLTSLQPDGLARALRPSGFANTKPNTVVVS